MKKLKLNVIFYYSDTCSTCNTVWNNVLECLEELEVGDFMIAKREAKDLKESNEYNVSDFPTIIVTDGVGLVYRVVGLTPKISIKKAIRDVDSHIKHHKNTIHEEVFKKT